MSKSKKLIDDVNSKKTKSKGQGSYTPVIAKSQAISGEVLKPKLGRPTKFTQAIADEICARLAMGESIRTVCKEDHLPSVQTFFNWLRTHQTFLEQYTRAKQESADAMAEDILDISDDGSNDWMERNFGGQEVWVTNGEALQRSKLRVDTRKWLMAKMKPRVYGDKLDVTSDGKAMPTPIIPIASEADVS